MFLIKKNRLMDPNIVLKLVREQRRQINDKFSPHQKLSPNHVSPNSHSNSHSSGTFLRYTPHSSQTLPPSYSNQIGQHLGKIIHNNCYQDKIEYNQDRIYNNYANFSDNLAPQAKKIPIHNNYYSNQQQISDISSIKKNDSEKRLFKNHVPNNISYFCNCKECNEKLFANEILQSNSFQEIGSQAYCDCPSCNMALSHQKNESKEQILAESSSSISPISPIPTKGFVISQNSSFSRIVPASKNYPTALEPKNNLNNFPIRDNVENKINENIKMYNPMNRCSCPECIQSLTPNTENRNQKSNNMKMSIHDKNSGFIFKSKKDIKINDQQTGLVMPVVLASSLGSCDDFKNIARQKNNFLVDKMAKRKLNGANENQVMCKKNRILKYEKPNNQLDNSNEINDTNKNEIELGEVVNVSMERSKSCNFPLNKVVTENFDRNSESPVIVSKKMMPMVAKRMNDWLERSVEFTYNFSIRSGLNMNKLFSILSNSWFKLLLIYMVENNLDFFVTKDNHETSKHHADYPREKDASELINLISKSHFDLALENEGYDLLREMVLLNENSSEPAFSECLHVTKLKLEENLKKIHEHPYEKLTFLLSNIQNIKLSLIKNLFYRNVPVQDVLNKKLMSLTSRQEIVT